MPKIKPVSILLLLAGLLALAACAFEPAAPQPTATAELATAEPATAVPPTPSPANTPDLLLVYRLEGGIAGFCDRLEIDPQGTASLTTCAAEPAPAVPLDPAQLRRLQAWADQYAPFSFVQTDGDSESGEVVADGMTVGLAFSGTGDEEAPEEVRQAILAFAQEMWAQVRESGQAPVDPTPSPTPAPQDGGTPESILILEPGPGSRVLSPVRITGLSDATFEQNLVVRLVDENGAEIALQPTTIQADIGQGGPFELELPFTVSGEQSAFIQVYATSPADGAITHLSSVAVRLADSGEPDLRPARSHTERIEIHSPALNDTLSGGSVLVEGFGLPSFEGTLVVELYDGEGSLLSQAPVLVKQPDIGLPGPFTIELFYTVTESGPGRLVVRDISPAFGGDDHLASVAVWLEP